MAGGNFGLELADWAADKKAISGIVLIGSRERPQTNSLESADEHSDWDFQIITSNPALLLQSAWTSELPTKTLYAYSIRRGQIGGLPKINAILSGTELDIIVIPEKTARILAFLVKMGLHRKNGAIRRRVQNLAEVIRPGWRFLKGKDRWDPIYKKIVREVSDPYLDNAEAKNLAEGFVCDYIWCMHKVTRGEFRAAQRVIYLEMGEVNLKLLYEVRRRRGDATYTKARRLERIVTARELEMVTIVASLDADGLRVALTKTAAACRELMAELVGNNWKWPAIG